jgi:lambda repressor-like predicted transcriptional regulator
LVLIHISGEHNVHPDVVIKFAKNKVATLNQQRSLARKAGNVTLARKLSKSILKYMNIIEVILDTKPKVVSLEADLGKLSYSSVNSMLYIF